MIKKLYGRGVVPAEIQRTAIYSVFKLLNSVVYAGNIDIPKEITK